MKKNKFPEVIYVTKHKDGSFEFLQADVDLIGLDDGEVAQYGLLDVGIKKTVSTIEY